jgi:imidazolonepropionase-like amidohydrolase
MHGTLTDPGRLRRRPSRAVLAFRVVPLALWFACTPPKAEAPAPPPPPPPLPWLNEAPPPSEVESPSIALVGATLLTGSGEELSDGVLVLGHGRIQAVGPRASVSVPDGAQVLDVSGKFITPGLIDAHSHMGVYPMPEVMGNADGNEATKPVTANVRAADAFWPQDPALGRALAAGITTILVLPGSANLVGGQGVTLKLLPGRSVADMLFPGAPPTLKMACGENPKRVYGLKGSAPSTRMGNVAGYREAFADAREYGAKWADYQARHQSWQRKKARSAAGEGEPAPTAPDRDFGLETLLGALEGRVLVEIHCYRADEMLEMMLLGDEFGVKVRAFHHAVEAYKIRDVLAARGVAVATWADWWGFKLEAFDTVRENLALLTEAGVRGVLHSDSASLVQRLNQEAAKSLSAGLRAGVAVDRGAALRWITSNAAWVLGVDAQTGSLEVGKMADVVVWSGDPFSVYSAVERVFVDGQLAYEEDVGARPSDFEVGQGSELVKLRGKGRPQKREPAPANAAPPAGNAAPAGAPATGAPSGSVPAPAGVAPASDAPAPSPAVSPNPSGTAPVVPVSPSAAPGGAHR